jgi:hypothetical protein
MPNESKKVDPELPKSFQEFLERGHEGLEKLMRQLADQVATRRVAGAPPTAKKKARALAQKERGERYIALLVKETGFNRWAWEPGHRMPRGTSKAVAAAGVSRTYFTKAVQATLETWYFSKERAAELAARQAGGTGL